METDLQNLSEVPTPEEVSEVNVVLPDNEKIQHQMYIDYCAIGGLMTDEDGNFTRITLDDFARNYLGVTRQACQLWKSKIVDFDAKVRARRIQISKGSRATKVYNGLYLKAATGDTSAVRLWAELFDDYQPAPQRMQHSLGDGFAEAAMIAQKRREQQAKAIEGKVVDEDKTL